MSMNAYEKARDLIQKIERHREEVANHQKIIGQLEVELQSALSEADLKGKENAAETPSPLQPLKDLKNVLRRPAPSVAVVTPSPSRSSSQKKQVTAPIKTAAPAPAGPVTKRSHHAKNGQKGSVQEVKPTLGDLVRSVLVKAGRPLNRVEIIEGLKELKYTNSAKDPYRTLGVRLHRLENRGVKALGNGTFELSSQWRKKLEREAQATAKKQAKEEAKAAPVTEDAAPETETAVVAP